MSWSTEVRVKFDDPKLFWKLGAEAEKRGVTLGNLLQDLARSAISPAGATPESARRRVAPIEQKMTPRNLKRLRELHAMGMSDSEIADRLDMSGTLVHRYRHDVLGLPVVRRGRRTNEDRARIALVGREDAA